MLLIKSKQIRLEFSSEPNKFKKYHKIKYSNSITSTSVKLGGISFIFSRHKQLNTKQLLVVLKIIKPMLKNVSSSGRIYLPIKVDTIITKKPKDIRMGRGKGAPHEKVFSARAGSPLFKLYNSPAVKAEEINRRCLFKLPKSYSLNSKQ